jgi:aromatic-L-amino-acid decarboxylase
MSLRGTTPAQVARGRVHVANGLPVTAGLKKGPSNSEALFPSDERRHRCDGFLNRELSQSLRRIAEGPVVPTLDLVTFRKQLSDFDFRTPHEIKALLSWVVAHMETGLVHVTHPRYFGLFNPCPTFPAQCADRIVSAFNPQLATWSTSPTAVEIEAHVIRALAERIGLPSDTTGHFTTGGTEANYTALLLALSKANEGFATEGARVFTGAPVFYVSRDSHLAWIKIAHQSGIGRSAVRLVRTDGSGRMDPNALREEIRRDRLRHCVPVMVAATAGTTNAGMIDPLQACAEHARAADLWYHVDAAWGGALIASDRLAGLLAGIEEADSLTIDAHKWFATTMGCGMLITTHPTRLSKAFQVEASYMPSNASTQDPYLNTIQWSRRFLGLRLFLSLAAVGWTGYGEHVERSIELAGLLRDQLFALGWSIANDTSLGVVCIEPPVGSSEVRTIVKRVLNSGRAWVSVAEFEGRNVIRACITNGETRRTDVIDLVDALRIAAQRRPRMSRGEVPECI